jgi:hypothetical protein
MEMTGTGHRNLAIKSEVHLRHKETSGQIYLPGRFFMPEDIRRMPSSRQMRSICLLEHFRFNKDIRQAAWLVILYKNSGLDFAIVHKSYTFLSESIALLSEG